MAETIETQEVPEEKTIEAEASERKKRVTVADLQKVIQTLELFMDAEIIPAIDAQEIRLHELEEAPTKLQPSFVPDINARMEALEKAIEILSGNQAALLKQYIEQEERITEAEDLITSLPTIAMDLQERPEHTELEFAKPPVQKAGPLVRTANIATVASVCLTMNDVLMICRTLKAETDIPDKDKILILNVACRAAGVDDTRGMRIRAGISATEAAV